MSRLKYAFHMRYADIIPFREAIANTPYDHLKGWERVCRGNRISTEGVLFWLWQTWSFQLEEIGRVNFLFVEWRFRGFKLPWPYGTLRIPVATLGQGELGLAQLNLNSKNAIT